MAVLSTSYEVESSVKTTLKNTIAPSTTVNIQINYALTITSGVLNLDGGTENEEYSSFGGATVLSGITTLSDVVRGLNLTGDTFTGSVLRAKQHIGGASTVELTNYHSLYNLKANKDRANTFTASQTISGTNKWFFNDSDTYIYDDGTDLKFKSSTQSEVALSTLAAAAGTDERAKVSVTDTTTGYLNNKIIAGSGLISNILNSGANEQLNIDINLAANSGLQVVGDQISIKAGSGIIISGGSITVDTSSLSNVSATDISKALVYGENITAPVALSLKGDTKAYKSDSSSTILTSKFIGIAKENGNTNDTKNVAISGPVATVSAFNVSSGNYWLGEANNGIGSNGAVITGTTQKGQSFIPQSGQANVSKIRLYLNKNSTPAGDYILKLFLADGSGLPTGAALGTVTLATASMASGWNDFIFVSPITVIPATKYVITLNHSLTDGGNNYSWIYNNSSTYANGNGLDSINSGTSWTNEVSNDYNFEIYFKSVSGQKAYLQNTPGAVGLTPGTYHQEIGTIINQTQIALNPQLASIFATYSFNASASTTVDTEVDLGFRPRLILASIRGNSIGALGFTLVSNEASSLYNQSFLDQNTGSLYFGALFSANLLQVNTDTQDALGNTGFNIVLGIQSSSSNSITIRRVVTKNNSPSNEVFVVNLYILE